MNGSGVVQRNAGYGGVASDSTRALMLIISYLVPLCKSPRRVFIGKMRYVYRTAVPSAFRLSYFIIGIVLILIFEVRQNGFSAPLYVRNTYPLMHPGHSLAQNRFRGHQIYEFSVTFSKYA